MQKWGALPLRDGLADGFSPASYIVTRMPANNAIGNTSLILPLVLTMICCRLPSDNTQCLPVLDPDFLSLN